MEQFCTAIILAAGQGTRMNSRLPKVCHRCFGEPLITHVERGLDHAGIENAIAVVGHGQEIVKPLLSPETQPVEQPVQRGTGDAVRIALETAEIPDESIVLITYGDIPGIRPATYQKILARFRKEQADMVLLTATLPDPAGYGRIVRENNRVAKIIEHREASASQREIKEINTGVICCTAAVLRKYLPLISADNQAEEYYLTDIIELLNRDSGIVLPEKISDTWEITGINRRAQLIEFEQSWYKQLRKQLLNQGVTLHDPALFKAGPWVNWGQDIVLENSVTLVGETTIGSGTRITGPSRIENSTIGEQSTIISSQITDARLGNRVRVGPYCHIRPGTSTGNDVRLGNFVEIKMSRIGNNTNVSHLSYIGDAILGENVNIGAGTITCNYDGYKKHRTTIGDNVFVGSNCELVAPLNIQSGAMLGAGSTITSDIPADSLGLTRPRQEIKQNWVKEHWKPRKQEETDQ